MHYASSAVLLIDCCCLQAAMAKLGQAPGLDQQAAADKQAASQTSALREILPHVFALTLWESTSCSPVHCIALREKAHA